MSSEDFKSLIVTDPDLVDEGIDVSGLRTTTDTSPFLLGNIPDYSGIQYDYLAPTKYTDLMRLYSQGLPTIDTSQPATPAPPSGGEGGSGDGGQATLPGFDDPTPEPIAGFDPGVTPGPSGFIGLDPEYDVSPFEYDDAQTYEPPASPSTSDPFLASGAAGGERLPTDTGIMVQDLTQLSNVGDFQITGASPLENQTGIIDNAVDPQAVKTILGPDGITYDAVTGQPIYEDLDAQAAATDVVTEEDLADNTGLLQKLGLPADFDLKQAALEAGINLVAGVPITLIAKGLEAVLPDRDPRQNALEEMYDVKDGTIQSGLMKGYNPVSGNLFNPTYGLQDAYQKRIDTINKTLGKMTLEEYQNTDLVQRKKDLEEAMAKEKAMLDQLQYGDSEEIDAGIQAADDDKGDDMLDTTPTSTFVAEEEDEIYEPPAPPSPPTGTNRPGGDNRDDSPAPSAPAKTSQGVTTSQFQAFRDPAPSAPSKPSVGTGSGGLGDYQVQPSKPSGPTYGPPSQSSGGGNGGSSGGGKIVCTMMNKSYGFGSFRNKIWLKHSKDLAPEYQKGYHKIFLPLVKLSKTNKLLKKMLEHIAVHRTIDIRQESRGKMHLLGRVYRKILEPICYIVGKYVK